MRITESNSSLWIVNYKRPAELYDTIKGWLYSFPFQEVNVICNGGKSLTDEVIDNFSVPVNLYNNWQNAEWEVDSLAQCWNVAMKKALLEKDWVVLSQDDVHITPGWHDKINESDYDIYIAPHGDVVQIISLEGFKKVGWFEERFRAIGGAENDYLLRCLKSIPERLSVHDNHIWQMRHNDVGLADHFSSNHTQVALQTRQRNLQFANAECFERWRQKWGGMQFPYIDQLFLNKEYHRQRNPGWEELDWYPSWTLQMKRLGRL